VKEFGSVDYIDFSPVDPFNFAVTSSVRVQIYNPLTKLVLKNISTFQKEAYGGSFRKDGRLLVAGDEEGKVRLFDVNTKTPLRVFTGHKAPVHRTFFTDLHQIASFSDDKTVKLWDVATERIAATFRDHEDYVRAGAVNPVSSSTILSGGYDQIVKMYDSRTDRCVMSLNHGAPIEALVFLPSGGIFVSAGGMEIKFWDAIGGGRMLGRIMQHTKTVTSLCVASNGRHLISGSLDQHVKFFNTFNYEMVHHLNYTSPVLSIGVAKDGSTLAVGQVNGTVAVHRRDRKIEDANVELKREKRRKFRKFKIADEVVDVPKKNDFKKYDVSLRKFEYSRALDQVMSRYVVNRTPEVTVGVMHELLKRNGLVQAFANRTQDSLARIVTFFNKYISDGRFTRVLLDIINVFVDIYEPQFLSLSPDVQRLFVELNRRIRVEEELTCEFLKLEGQIEMLLRASEVSSEQEVVDLTKTAPLLPSNDAMKSQIIEV
jgi:U3 small nucleolar RNA-associated protein 15